MLSRSWTYAQQKVFHVKHNWYYQSIHDVSCETKNFRVDPLWLQVFDQRPPVARDKLQTTPCGRGESQIFFDPLWLEVSLKTTVDPLWPRVSGNTTRPPVAAPFLTNTYTYPQKLIFPHIHLHQHTSTYLCLHTPTCRWHESCKAACQWRAPKSFTAPHPAYIPM